MSPRFGMLVIYLFLATLGSVTAAGNHPACGTGHPAIPPGSSMERIMDGVEAIPHEFPWQVIIMNERGFRHGGSILNSQWILTSGDSLWQTNFTIYAGKHRFEWNNGSYYPEKGEQIRMSDMTRRFIHPNHLPRGWDYNVGLIKLPRPLSPFPTTTIRPICLPGKSPIDRFAGQRCIVAGWGVTSYTSELSKVLRKTVDTIWKQADCVANLKQYYPDFWRTGVTDRMLCLGGKIQQIAWGDRGHPVVCLGEVNRTQRWIATGINYYHIFKNHYLYSHLATVHTRVSEVSDWVWETIEKNGG